jgi:hypothetical protein
MVLIEPEQVKALTDSNPEDAASIGGSDTNQVEILLHPTRPDVWVAKIRSFVFRGVETGLHCRILGRTLVQLLPRPLCKFTQACEEWLDIVLLSAA